MVNACLLRCLSFCASLFSCHSDDHGPGDLLARNLAEAQRSVQTDSLGPGIDGIPDLVDMIAWRRYCTLIGVFKVHGEEDQNLKHFSSSFEHGNHSRRKLSYAWSPLRMSPGDCPMHGHH